VSRLSPAVKGRLALEILGAYVDVRRSLRRADFQSVVESIRNANGATGTEAVDPRRLGRAVTRTLRLLPTDSRCLMQSLVLTELLARRGIRSTLVIGVASGPEFAAHAWVESSGRPLLPSREPLYQRLVEL
jgi:hypothetical protein